jgi:hypothetical protein
MLQQKRRAESGICDQEASRTRHSANQCRLAAIPVRRAWLAPWSRLTAALLAHDPRRHRSGPPRRPRKSGTRLGAGAGIRQVSSDLDVLGRRTDLPLRRVGGEPRLGRQTPGHRQDPRWRPDTIRNLHQRASPPRPRNCFPSSPGSRSNGSKACRASRSAPPCAHRWSSP